MTDYEALAKRLGDVAYNIPPDMTIPVPIPILREAVAALRSLKQERDRLRKVAQQLKKPLHRMVEESMERNGPQIDPAFIRLSHDLDEALAASQTPNPQTGTK